ncbi:MAG: hypothetical protein JNN09_06740 [Alphaproteobacteria bacterium]|nr:hypothetical protein [Alphaproteobacteria bacterium]
MKKLCGLLAVLLTLTNAGSAAAGTDGSSPPPVSDMASKVIIVANPEGEGLLAYQPVITPNGAQIHLAPTGHYTLPDGQGVDVVQGQVVQLQ